MNRNKVKALNKYINEILKPIYPEVKKFELLSLEIYGEYLLRIIVDDESITEKNMYQKGIDPHYILKHIQEFLKYFEPKEEIEITVIIGRPNGEIVYRSNFFEKM